ncbi:MAG: NAD(P)H-dependent oxidoreductase [Candidatus Nanoarchaeia archaeon]
MKTLIIYAHPKKEGHNATILNYVIRKLIDKKQKYEVVDLYKEKFDPVLSETEINTRGNPSKEIKKYQDKIAKADNLIFIYPIWWNAPPAILKGFVDRVFAAGFAFRYVKKYGRTMPEGLLQGKKAIVFTTGGGPAFYFKYFLKSRGSLIMVKDTLGFCGIKSKGFHYGNAIKISPEAETKIEKLVKKGINWMY